MEAPVHKYWKENVKSQFCVRHLSFSGERTLKVYIEWREWGKLFWCDIQYPHQTKWSPWSLGYSIDFFKCNHASIGIFIASLCHDNTLMLKRNLLYYCEFETMNNNYDKKRCIFGLPVLLPYLLILFIVLPFMKFLASLCCVMQM